MATENKTKENRPQAAAKKRRRKPGVPTLLVVFLLIIAIIFGGLVGFAIARSTDDSRAQLQMANDRIMELENTLTLIGFSSETDEVDEFIFDDSADIEGVEALAGEFGDETAGMWNDDSLLAGTLTEPAESVVVAEFDGGQLTSEEVIPEYNDQLTTQIFAGYNAEEISDSLLQEVLSYMVSDKIIEEKAKALGLTTLTAEDESAIAAEAYEIYADQLAYYSAFVTEIGMTPEAINEAAAEYMETEEGISLESITQELKDTWWAQKFYDYTVQGVTVTDEEVKAEYDALLASQKENFTAYPEEYEYAHTNNDLLLYNPEGYRAVKHILIPFTNVEDEAAATDLMDQIAQLDPSQDAETIMQYQSQLDAIYASLEATADEVLNKLNAGESFDSLIHAYGADDGMAMEPMHSKGYYISSNSFLWSNEFVEGAMMLEKVGDISAPVRSSYGVHIIQYVADVKAGEVPFAEVQAQMKEEVLAMAQADYYEDQRALWLQSANVQYYPERLQ